MPLRIAFAFATGAVAAWSLILMAVWFYEARIAGTDSDNN